MGGCGRIRTHVPLLKRKGNLHHISSMPNVTEQPHHRRIRTWAPPTILGLLIGIAVSIGVVKIRPQVTVLPQCTPLRSGQVVSIPFRISNIGYFPFTVVTAHCYIHNLSGMTVNTSTLLTIDTEATVHDKSWDNRHLGRGEGRTLICETKEPEVIMPTDADITVVVDYKASIYPTSRGYFRFIGASGDNWQWLAQPSQGIQRQADKGIEEQTKAPQQ